MKILTFFVGFFLVVSAVFCQVEYSGRNYEETKSELDSIQAREMRSTDVMRMMLDKADSSFIKLNYDIYASYAANIDSLLTHCKETTYKTDIQKANINSALFMLSSMHEEYRVTIQYAAEQLKKRVVTKSMVDFLANVCKNLLISQLPILKGFIK